MGKTLKHLLFLFISVILCSLVLNPKRSFCDAITTTTTPPKDIDLNSSETSEDDWSSSFTTPDSDPDRSEGDMCPECIIQREVLDRLPPQLYPPRNSKGHPVSLKTKIVVKELMDMSVKIEQLTIMVWIRMYWRNPQIHWNATRLKIREIRVSPKQVWTPDLVVSNSLSSFEAMDFSSSLPVIVGYDGFTYYSVPMIMRTKCQANVTYFPFDEQVCEITLTSWTYHSNMVNLTLTNYTTVLEDPIGNIEWQLVNISARTYYDVALINHPLYPNQTLYYPYIRYKLLLVRKPDFYINSLITPSLLLSWLGSIIFLLPADCGEKLGFSVTLFLALYVNQVVVSDFLPPSADSFPLLARFYTTITLIMGLSILFTVVSLAVHFRVEPTVMPVKGSLMYTIFCLLERLGSCSLLTLFNPLLRLINRRADKTNPKPQRHSAPPSPSRTSSVLKKFSTRVAITRNGCCKEKPCEFVYNSACATPIPNSSTQLSENWNETFPKIDCDKVSEKIQKMTAQLENDCKFEWPKEIKRVLLQIKDQLDVISKASKDGNKKDIGKKRWILIAAGMDTIFFFLYIIILSAVTLFFAYKATLIPD